jgi:HPt (histidine-containing phosphotransfer) domain-containing protein
MSNNSITGNHRLYNLKKLYEIEQSDEHFIHDLVKIFLETMSSQSCELIKYCDEKNWERVYCIAHKMKANIDLLSIEMLKTEIRFVEQNARAETCLSDLPEKIFFIHSGLQKVAAQLDQDFQKQ